MIDLAKAGRTAALVILTALPFGPAAAGDVTLGDIVVHRPWARATPGGAQVGAGYLAIENRGAVADRLIGGSLAASRGFEVHSMTTDGGVMRMRPTGPLEILPGKTVVLDPSNLHIMFTGLTRGLRKGETIPGTLVFEHAGTAKVDFTVEGIGAKGPGGEPGGHPGVEAAPAHSGHPMSGMDMD